MFRRRFSLAYAGIAHAVALANIAFILGFLAGFGVPKGINDGVPGARVQDAMAVRQPVDGFCFRL